MIKKLAVELEKPLSTLVNGLLEEEEILEGFVVLQGLSTTSAIITSASEKFSNDSIYDLKKELSYLIPSKEEFVSEGDPKLVSSICKSSMVGNNLVVPIRDGKLVLGYEEDIYYLDFYNEENNEIVISIN